MTKLWTLIRHNQSLVIGISLVTAVAVWAYGCQSKAVSILTPPARVTRQELQLELDSLSDLAAIRFADLDRQDKFKAAFFNMAIEYSKGGTINPIAFAITIGNILGLSAIIDNRRKDVHIKTLKNNELVSKIPPVNNN